MAVLIQSRSSTEESWQDEGSKRNHFKAYLTALAKSRATGRVYRLLTSDGDVLEQIGEPACDDKPDRTTQVYQSAKALELPAACAAAQEDQGAARKPSQICIIRLRMATCRGDRAGVGCESLDGSPIRPV